MVPLGLVVFDLDGTLLRGRTVCEVLADALGHENEMAAFERLTSEPDIASARAEMALWYKAVSRTDLVGHLANACLAPGAREGVELLLKANVKVGIASITWGFAAEWFAIQLGIQQILATGLDSEGNIGHVWPRDKATWLQGLALEHEIPLDRTAAVGDSAGDLPMLDSVALPFFVGVQPPAGRAYIHMPGSDIREIAQIILGKWRP
jgi:phosphoserine phosphatase